MYIFFFKVLLDQLLPHIPEVPNQRIPSPVDGEPILDSEESTSDFSSPAATSTPALSFINGKHEVSIEPEKSYAEKEARGDVFETVSSTLQNLAQTNENVETSNFDYSLVDTGATRDGTLETSQDVTYPMPIILSTVKPNNVYDTEQIIVDATPSSSVLPDPEDETLMEEGILKPNTPITGERSFSSTPRQPPASPTNATAIIVETSKPVDTKDEISLPIEDGSGQERATIKVVQMTQKSTTLPETLMSAPHQTDMFTPDITEKQAISISTIMVTSSPAIENITLTKSLFEAEEEGSGSDVIPSTKFSTVFPLHSTAHSEQTITSTAVNTAQRVDETVSVRTVSEDMETNQATVSPLPFSSSYIAMEPTTKQVQINDISEKVIQEPFTATVQHVMSEEGSGDQSLDNTSGKTIATTVPSKLSEMPFIDASEMVFSTESSEKKTTGKFSVESIDQGLASTKSESLLHLPDTEGSGNQIPETFTTTTTLPVWDGTGLLQSEGTLLERTSESPAIAFSLRNTVSSTPELNKGQETAIATTAMITSYASTTIPAFFMPDGPTIKVETFYTNGPENENPSSTITSDAVTSAPLHSTPEDEFSGDSISNQLNTTSFVQVHSIVTDEQYMTTRATQSEAEDRISTTTTSGIYTSTIVSKESYITSAPTQEMPQSEGSGEESGEFEDGISGDFSNTVVESTPPSQAPSMGTELPVHTTVIDLSSNFAHSTVADTVLAFTVDGGSVDGGSGDQNEDNLSTVSVTSPTSVTTSSLSITADHFSTSMSQKSNLHNATYLSLPTIDMETLRTSSIDHESSILEGSADNLSETTEASKDYSIRTDEAEISYTKSTLDYSDVEMTTLSTKLTESTSQIPLSLAQTDLMSSSLESGSGDTEDATIETEEADDEGSGDLTSTVLESSPPSVSSRMENVSMTSVTGIKHEGTVDNQILTHVEVLEMPTTEVNTEFSVKTDEVETSENKTTLDYLTLENSTQYTKFKSEFTSTMPSMIQKETSDTGSGDMEDTTSEGTEDEGTEDDGSGAFIESAAPSQASLTDRTTENTKASTHTGINDLPLVVSTSTFTDSVASTNKDNLSKQSTVTTMPVMVTGADSIYLTSKHVDIDRDTVSTTDVIKGTLKPFTEDGGSGDEILVTITSELHKSTSITVEATTQSATSTRATAKVQLSPSATNFTETKDAEDNLEISTEDFQTTTESSYTTLVNEVSIQTSPKSVVISADVTTPVLPVIYHDGTDKEVTTVVPSSSEIRSSKITTRLHDTKSNTSPVIIFTEEIKNEDELFSTVTDSMRHHSITTEIITKDDMIIDADTASVLEPSSPFASTIITEEAAGITAVTITPHSSSILIEGPEGSGTDNPVLPSSDLHMPTQSPSHITTSQPKTISYVTSAILHSELRTTHAIPKTTILVENISGDSVSVEESGMQTSIPGVTTPRDLTPTNFTADANFTLNETVSSTSKYNTEKTTSSKQSVFNLVFQNSVTEEGSGFISKPTASSGSDITGTTSVYKTAASRDIAEATEHDESDYESTTNPFVQGKPHGISLGASEIEVKTTVHPNMELKNDTSLSTTQSIITVQPTANYEVTDIVRTESIESKPKATSETVPISSKMPLVDSTRGPVLQEESSGDVVSETVNEESTAVSFKDSTDFPTTHSDALLSLSIETESTTYAPPILMTSSFHPEAVYEMTLTAESTKDTPAAAEDFSSTTTTTPMVSTSTSEDSKYTPYHQTTKQGVQLTSEIPIMESNTDLKLDDGATTEPSLVESKPGLIDFETFSKPESETLLESTSIYESKTSDGNTEWSSISDKTRKEEVTTVIPSSKQTSPASAVSESTDYTTSLAIGIQIHSDTTGSPKDFSDDTLLVEGSAPNPEILIGTQRPGLIIDQEYTFIGETYDITGMTIH